MSSNPFSFPPPPPPPPQATYIESSNPSFRGGGRGDKRWERGSRGRGRGTGQRGSRGGSHNYGSYPSNSAPSNGGQIRGSYPLPNYPPVQQPQYPADPRDTYGITPPQYPPVASTSAATYYSSPYQVPHPQAAAYPYSSSSYPPHVPQYPYQFPYEPPQHSNRYTSPPVAGGPPIRIGFGAQDVMHARSTPQAHHDHLDHTHRQNPSNSRPPPHQQRSGRGHHNKRGSSNSGATVNSMRSCDTSMSRVTQVAPAVPSFGNPLPVKPPAPMIEAKKAKRKKKRRVNQLGLTPKTDEHVSSSEEEDVDEELKLATTVVAANLEFTYKGQTSTLHTSDEIASWLEERKKRFPTAARRAENEERLQKLRDESEQKKQALKAERLLERQKRTLEKDKQAIQQDKSDAAARAKLKIERLRQKLQKEEHRIAKAEAKSLKRAASLGADEATKRPRLEVQTGGDASTEVVVAAAGSREFDKTSKSSPVAELSDPVADPLTPTSQPPLPDPEVKPEELQNRIASSALSADDTSDDTLEDDDDTSSSGSSSSRSGSDVEGPETASSRPNGPRKVPPPRKLNRQEKAVCRDFLNTGRCRRGKRCRWRHALPERGQKKAEEEAPLRVERKSLHQRLVEQELENERQEHKKLELHSHKTKSDTQTTVA
ncbi:MAG: hypothetical protein Q9213_000238 [Squamulea squamosa]